ncbi:hypothetical protein BGZ63DRAFT_426034 [Mariannaea sp. PMI_226]|nr:hypothetical protein BGZ63DRAFT_426034 [Mariannaea sp. PMI_226]
MDIEMQHTSEAQVSQEEIHRKPWKFIGYPGYSKLISSDDDFFILRRFATLNTRVALALQDEICVLEEELNDLDRYCSSKETDDLNNGTFRGDVKERKELVQIISKKLYHYNKFVVQQSTMRQYPHPKDRDVDSLNTWHANYHCRAIATKEMRYLDSIDDLFCVTPREKSPMRRLLDKSQWLRTLSVWEEKKRNEEMESHGMKNIMLYSDRKMDQVASLVVAAVGVVMLLAPIWILQALRSLETKLAVISVFIFTFLITLSFIMVSRPFEALGATAGQVF